MPPEGIQIYRITDATGALIAKEQDPMVKILLVIV